ncbi:hypothetical protein N866_06025 [Actinotalea ferrariae CF5-4]|uniref:Uncharacterized protein n=1 Tax=Actinotalea ferrariae CF5-4 TaxID=948458 RepID=A0A021VYV9_9CELL|nr:hypothetical protein [Actinotalea ferrariae]EYR65210.1 hypothetical protein N866_06025 [Actinotalea ferrariae CF5-4]
MQGQTPDRWHRETPQVLGAPRRRSVPRRVAGLLVTALAVGACGTSAGAPAPTSAAADGALDAEALTAEIRQSRSDWGVRRVQVRIHNASDEPVDVATATLETSIVDRPTTSDPARGRPVPPGRYRDFPVDLGGPVCPAGEAPSSSVLVRAADGREVTLTPGDPQGHLPRIHREDCAEQRVREAVRLELGPTVTAEQRDGRLVGALTLTATAVDPDVEVSVTRVDGTVLLLPLGAPSWSPPELLRVGPAPATAVLEFLPARCDPHAVAEDKRGTYLPVHVTLDGEAQPVVHLRSPDPLRGQVYDHIAAACGW